MADYIDKNPGQKRYRFLLEKKLLKGDELVKEDLDAVEQARKELEEPFRVRVTCAHLEIQDDADLDRFEKLGVIANYTPHWHAGDMEVFEPLLGKDADFLVFDQDLLTAEPEGLSYTRPKEVYIGGRLRGGVTG